MQVIANFLVITIAFASSAIIFGQTHAQNSNDEEFNIPSRQRSLLAKTEGSEFAIDPNLVDKFFTKTTTESTSNTTSHIGKFDLGYGYTMLNVLHLQNDYFEIAYEENTSGVSSALGQYTRKISSLGRSELSLFSAIGYSFLQGIYKVKGKAGNELRDNIATQWVPVDVGVTGDLRNIPMLRTIVGLVLGCGVDLINQSGNLDGINQNFVLPHVIAGPSLTIFSQSQSGIDGFDGITMAGVYRRALSNQQAFNAWTVLMKAGFSI